MNAKYSVLVVAPLIIVPAIVGAATFSDANWMSLGGVGGADAWVNAAVTDGLGNLYIGGRFTIVGNVLAANVARWDGRSWSALGSGLAGGDSYGPHVFALAVSGGTLYAGGDFTTAGGNAATNIAQWNGSSWSALGSGMTGYYGIYKPPGVYALAVSGTNLYAGGYFTTAGGIVASNIAQWNGSSWSALGSGIDDQVLALAVSGGTLYAGGWFTTAGGTNADHIAQWNGSSWSPLGGGVNNLVQALAMSGGTLYAGGSFFFSAGGTSGSYIAQWNGSSWSPLGSGVNSDVSALAVSGDTLYAGGSFALAGGTNANYIAQWNGSSWSPLGSGMNGGVIALAASGGMLYAGGGFTTAGGNVSPHAAGAVLNPSPVLNQPNFAGDQFQFTVAGPAGTNAVIYANTNLATGPWVPLATNGLGVGSFIFSDPLASNYPARFYRAALQPTYTIGGTVTGLTPGDSVVLTDYYGSNDALTVTANGSFTFATPLPSGATYNVYAFFSSYGASCTVTYGTGTIGTSNITNVIVTCWPFHPCKSDFRPVGCLAALLSGCTPVTNANGQTYWDCNDDAYVWLLFVGPNGTGCRLAPENGGNCNSYHQLLH